jgi:hypothetical protein
MNDGRQRLDRLSLRQRRRRLLGVFFDAVSGALLGGASGAVAGSVLAAAGPSTIGGVVAGGAAGAFASWRAGRAELRRAAADAARHFDSTTPQAEWSAELLIAGPESLPPLARLQRERVERALAEVRLPALPRGTWGWPLARLAIAAVVAAGMLTVGFSQRVSFKAAPAGGAASSAAATAPIVARVAVEVDPPAYTRRPPHFADGWAVRAEEEALVRFRIQLAGLPVDAATLRFGEDEVPLTRGQDGAWQGERRAQRGELYALHAAAGGREVLRGPLARLDVIRDQPPALQVLKPAPLTLVPAAAPGTLALEVAAQDDYGVAGVVAHVVVAHGGGEQVTFRELERTLQPLGGGRYAATLDLAALGLGANPGSATNPAGPADRGSAAQPGIPADAAKGARSAAAADTTSPADPSAASSIAAQSVSATAGIAPATPTAPGAPVAPARSAEDVEAFLRFEARDNREPEPGRTRSATLRIRVAQAGAARSAELESGIVLQVALEMFRSERQIILDTQQLLRAAAHLAAAELQRRAEGIGFDQRALRLRYGALLGEEVESGVAVEAAAAAVRAARPVPSPPGSGRPSGPGRTAGAESEEEEPAAPARPSEPRAMGAFDVAAAGGDRAAALAKALPEGMVHLHDSAESATYFPDAVRREMRDVLAAMWGAEGRLRVGDPRTALPFEERALRMLKDAQQRSRVYVAKAAFEAPEVDPARRLTGDLAAIATQRATRAAPPPDPLRDAATWAAAVCAARSAAASASRPLAAAARAAVEQALQRAALAGDTEALEALAAWRAAAQPGCREARAIAPPLWRLLSPPPPAIARPEAE